MNGRFRVEQLGPHHDRAGFQCGVGPLDRYLHSQVGQDVRRGVTACFVATDDETAIVAGYYTLAMSSVLLADLPDSTARKLPRYPTVPAARLGRLATDQRFRGVGLGGALLWDAIERVAKSEIAAFAILVDAKDDSATAFYQHHGFLTLAGDGSALFLSLAAISAVGS